MSLPSLVSGGIGRRDYFFLEKIGFASLYDRELLEYLMAFNENGALTDNFFVEVQYSKRELNFVNSVSRYRNCITGSPAVLTLV